MPATSYPLLFTLLRRYFYSGWAFFIPYLAAYLLYYITGWPVNPANHAGEVAPISTLTPLAAYSSYLPIPSLLHLYWILHALHLILAGAALWGWFQDRRAAARLSAAPLYSLPATHYSLLTALAPWALLALIFYIPGVYLEWPSDPWEHLRRINEWSILDTVGAHSSWHKSSYFIPYSLLSWCTGVRQFFWLDFYYTVCCLSLCWQYYRLARVVGLGERPSFVFVLLQAALLGNDLFSFYRYYGISTGIYSQVGAVAFIRIIFEFDLRRFLVRPIATLALVGGTLLTFIAFNHIQGLGIAALGAGSVIVFHLVSWRRASFLWILLLASLTSIGAILCLPRPPAFETVFLAKGWLNNWYGFNFLSLNSPATTRAVAILGLSGLLNLGAGLWLFRRNAAVAWCTWGPLLALMLPCVAVPLTLALESRSSDEIITFHRMLLAIPSGLAVISLGEIWVKTFFRRHPALISGAMLAILLFLCSATPSAPTFNRFYHSLYRTPTDLAMHTAVTTPIRIEPPAERMPAWSLGYAEIRRATGQTNVTYGNRASFVGLPKRLDMAWHAVGETLPIRRFPVSSAYSLLPIFSPWSPVGLMSGHWVPHDAALEFAAQAELDRWTAGASNPIPD